MTATPLQSVEIVCDALELCQVGRQTQNTRGLTFQGAHDTHDVLSIFATFFDDADMQKVAPLLYRRVRLRFILEDLPE